MLYKAGLGIYLLWVLWITACASSGQSPPLDKDKQSLPLLENGPLVSVIITVYNVESYLVQCLASIMDQTYKNLEIIVIDDHSADNSTMVIRNAQLQDRRIVPVFLTYTSFGGTSTGSNLGIKMAKGEYIFFVDGDDFVDVTAIHKLVYKAESTKADVVICDFYSMSRANGKVYRAYDHRHWPTLPRSDGHSSEGVFSLYAHPEVLRLSPVPWRKLYRRSFLGSDIRFEETDDMLEDNPFHWLVVIRAKAMVVLKEALVTHRFSRSQANRLTLMSYLHHFQNINKYLKQADVDGAKNMSAIWAEFYQYIYWQGDRTLKWLEKWKGGSQMLTTKVANILSLSLKNLRLPDEQFIRKFLLRKRYFDVSIVIPIGNPQQRVKRKVAALLQYFRKKNVLLEIILVENFSYKQKHIERRSMEKEFKDKHVYLLSEYRRGAGLARNTGMRFVEGQYTFFLDADDAIIPNNLMRNVYSCHKGDYDLCIFPYYIVTVDKNNMQVNRDMFPDDVKHFEHIFPSIDINSDRYEAFSVNRTERGNKDRDGLNISCFKNAAYSLINYPWNKIVKTSLLKEHLIQFPPFLVHNDVPYHWWTITAAKSIFFSTHRVVRHFKFDRAVQSQLTSTQNAFVRMQVLDSFVFTKHILERYEEFCQRHSHVNAWEGFRKHLIGWAKGRIPKEKRKEFSKRAIDAGKVSLSHVVHHDDDPIDNDICYFDDR